MSFLVLKLIAAHLLAAFILQPHARIQGRAAKSVFASGLVFLWNSILFLFLASLLILPAHQSTPLDLTALVYLLSWTALSRFVIDMLTARTLTASWQECLVVQIAQLAAIVVISWRFADIPGLSTHLARMWNSPRTYVIIVAYALSLGLGSAIVPLVTGSVASRDSEMGKGATPGMKDAGRYIGVLERLMITTLIIFWPKLDAAAIGLIFSAKSIARFPEFKKQDFAEYYLLGTLTSFLIAIGAGLLVRLHLP